MAKAFYFAELATVLVESEGLSGELMYQLLEVPRISFQGRMVFDAGSVQVLVHVFFEVVVFGVVGVVLVLLHLTATLFWRQLVNSLQLLNQICNFRRNCYIVRFEVAFENFRLIPPHLQLQTHIRKLFVFFHYLILYSFGCTEDFVESAVFYVVLAQQFLDLNLLRVHCASQAPVFFKSTSVVAVLLAT